MSEPSSPETVAATVVTRRRPFLLLRAPPTRPNPAIIIAQLADSGTALTPRLVTVSVPAWFAPNWIV